MRLNIIDPNTLELVGVLSNYESVQWSPTFNTPDGSFQIDCSIDYVGLLKNEYLVENTAELEHVGVIKKVQTVASNEKTKLKVNGIMLEKDIIYKRIIKAFVMYQDVHPADVIDNLMGICLLDPAEPKRKIPNIGEISIPKKDDFDIDVVPIQYSCNYANLGDEIYTLIQNVDLGIKAHINHTTNKIDVDFYFGVDRTLGSDEAVIFSPERGTVIETTYLVDSSQNITNLTAIGENNVILQAERERQENEPMLEKSIDLSGELPWPTYQVEKPEEEGGRYYRYKKFTPPADFITNRDVWEKYEVERIETEETCYREVEVTGEKREITEEEIFYNSEISRAKRTIRKVGALLDSAVSVRVALNNYKKNEGSVTSKIKTIGYLYKAQANLVPTKSASPMKTRAKVKTKKKVSSAKKAVKTIKNVVSAVKGTSSKLSGLSQSLTPTQLSELAIQTLTGETDAEGNIKYYVTDTSTQLEPYQNTVVTYETKDFLEYVYVNIGQSPSGASKIIQGSVASGDVMYYENYEDVKVEESQYRNVLLKKAEDYLKTFVVAESVSTEPYKLSNMVYGKNYSLGDIVTARNRIQGFSKDFILTSVVETWDSKGYTIEITLGDDVPSLTNRIKLLSKDG